jgi:hypothetical protein
MRYRYDGQLGKHFKTIELIVEESPYTPAQTHIAGETVRDSSDNV